MRALLNHLVEHHLLPDQFETIALVGCGRIQDLPESHRTLARNFVYIEPNPRFTETNTQAVSPLVHSRFVSEALGLEDSHSSSFYQFNLPQFDGLVPLNGLQATAGNLRQVTVAHVRSRTTKNLLTQLGLSRTSGSACIVLDIGELGIRILQDSTSWSIQVNRLVLALPKQIPMPTDLSGWSKEFQGTFGPTGQQLVILVPAEPVEAVLDDVDVAELSDLRSQNEVLKQEVELLRARVAELESKLDQSHAAEPKDYALALKQSEERNRLTNNELLKGLAQIDLIKELMLKDSLS